MVESPVFVAHRRCIVNIAAAQLVIFCVRAEQADRVETIFCIIYGYVACLRRNIERRTGQVVQDLTGSGINSYLPSFWVRDERLYTPFNHHIKGI